MTRSLLGVLAVAGLGLTALCDKPKPQPTPSPTATATPAPTPEPTATPSDCPPVEEARVRIRCGRFSDWQDGEQWDCEPLYLGQVILPEGDPRRAECDLAAVGGTAPEYLLDGVTGSLRIAPRVDRDGNVRPFRFALYGTGTGRLVCLVGDGHDACAGRAVSR